MIIKTSVRSKINYTLRICESYWKCEVTLYPIDIGHVYMRKFISAHSIVYLQGRFISAKETYNG